MRSRAKHLFYGYFTGFQYITCQRQYAVRTRGDAAHPLFCPTFFSLPFLFIFCLAPSRRLDVPVLLSSASRVAPTGPCCATAKELLNIQCSEPPSPARSRQYRKRLTIEKGRLSWHRIFVSACDSEFHTGRAFTPRQSCRPTACFPTTAADPPHPPRSCQRSIPERVSLRLIQASSTKLCHGSFTARRSTALILTT